MFGLLLERCNLLVARTETAGVLLEPTCQLEEDLCNLLAPVKVRTLSIILGTVSYYCTKFCTVL